MKEILKYSYQHNTTLYLHNKTIYPFFIPNKFQISIFQIKNADNK